MSKKKKAKKVTQEGKFDHPLYGWATSPIEYDLPVFRANRGSIEFPEPNFTSQNREVIYMGVSISRLFHVASLVAFGGAVLGSTLFGHGGLELVSAGLFLHVGADLAEDVLAG